MSFGGINEYFFGETSADWVGNDLNNVGSLSIFDSAQDNTFTISSSVDLAANRVLNLPLITADDTFAFLGVDQTFTGIINFVDDNSSMTTFTLTSYGSTESLIVQRRARGTLATPVAINDNAESKEPELIEENAHPELSPGTPGVD